MEPSIFYDETDCMDNNTCSPLELNRVFKYKYKILDEIVVSPQNDYILNLCTDRIMYCAAVGISDGSAKIFDVHPNYGLIPIIQNCIPKPKVVNPKKRISICGVRFLDDAPNTVLVGTTNALIRLYDLRTGKEQARFVPRKIGGNMPTVFSTFDRNANGRIICAGTEQVASEVYLLFFDIRQRKQVGGYFQSHHNDVTSVKFHETYPDLLCTGATDGLINIFDIKERSEDEALQLTVNTESSVYKLNWHKNIFGLDFVSCITPTNDFMTYASDTGRKLFDSKRSDITDNIKRINPSNLNLINVHNMENDRNVFILAGSNSGDVLRSVNVVNNNELTPWAMFNGNNQVIRDSVYNAKRNILLTGGENGILTAWVAEEDEICN